MASGWNLWVWLQCIGVVSGCCCKEVHRYPHQWRRQGVLMLLEQETKEVLSLSRILVHFLYSLRYKGGDLRKYLHVYQLAS